jgi:outer membrane scaffolding protein for murein synthesis (MipA/OmpV family)
MNRRCLPSLIVAGLALFPAMAAQAASDWDLAHHWDVAIGGGALYGPTYEGADSLRPSPIPYFDFEWNDRLSLSSDDGLHFAFVDWQHLSFGFAGNAKLPRKPSDDSALHRLGRVGLSLEAGGYIDYNPPGFDISLEVRHDIAGGHGGTVAEFNVRGQLPIGQSFVMEFGPNVNWASKNYMQSYFGITPSQSLKSGFKKFSPNGGLKDVGFTVSGAYLFDQHWRLLLEANYARLMDNVADSPLIREKGDPNQYSLSVVVAYHF